MKPATLLGSAALIVYVNLVPYVCRMPRGVRWVKQYVPDEGHLVEGLLFIGAWASLPAIPLIVALVLRKRLPATYAICVTAATALLVYWHHDYDMAADAQAAIGLIFIPIYVLGLTTAVGAVSAVVELFVRRSRRSPTSAER